MDDLRTLEYDARALDALDALRWERFEVAVPAPREARPGGAADGAGLGGPARLVERLRVHDHLIGKMQAASARRASIRVARDIAGEVAARLLDDAEPPGSRGDKRPQIRRVHSK